jgi:hypothetical protein
MESAKHPRPGSLFEKKEVFLERSKELLAVMKEEAAKSVPADHVTQFTDGVHAPTVMIRAAVAKTASDDGGRIHIAVRAVHGWTVRSLNRITGRA